MSFFSPVNQARWARFRHNRRGYWSLWRFLILFLCSLGAELLANDRPLLVQYRGQLYVPVLKNYTEQTFGGAFATAADYQDPWLQQQLATHGWALWPPVRFGATTINFASTVPFPSPPSASNWLGTDANGGVSCSRALPLNMATTALKRVNMALRWLVRDDGIVDMGIWHSIPKSKLFIPLDVHVGNTARALGLLDRRANDRRAVEQLTALLRTINPDDPCIYDYALFGLGIESRNNIKINE